MTSAGPSVVEFNCRFGDPETQSVLALLETPLAGLLHAAATGTLATAGPLRWQPGYAVTVVIAAENYPGRPRVGDVITGSDVDGVLHAGTARRDDGAAARAAAYATVGAVRLPGSHFRSDIALAAERGEITL